MVAGQKEALSAKDTGKNQKKLREKYSLHNNDFRPGSFWCSCWYFDFLSKQTFFETDASSASYVPPRYILSISTGQNSHFRSSAENQHVLSSQLLLCGDVESNPGPEHTNRETSIWLKATIAQNLTMREHLEKAKMFFGGFSGDHRTFVSWKEDFLRKQQRMKKEAQERLMKDVGSGCAPTGVVA